MWRHTKVKVWKIEGAPKILCNSDYYFQSYGILEKIAHVSFLWSSAILKVSVEPNWFSNLT